MSTPAQRLRAKRQARWRQRQRHDVAVVAIEVPYNKLVNALLVTGALSDSEGLDRKEVARVLGDKVAAWAAEWSE